MFRKIVTLSALVLLSSTHFAHAGAKKDAVINAISQGESGGLAFVLRNCDYAFTNKLTGKTFGPRGKRTGIIEVPPGTYKFDVSLCSDKVGGKRVRFSHRLSNFWFDDIEVKGGELVYPGTITGHMITYKPDKIMIKGSFLGEGPKKFPIYKNSDLRKTVFRKVVKKYPELENRLVINVVESLRDEDTVQAIINSAHVSDESGEREKFDVRNEKSAVLYTMYVLYGISPNSPPEKNDAPSGVED